MHYLLGIITDRCCNARNYDVDLPLSELKSEIKSDIEEFLNEQCFPSVADWWALDAGRWSNEYPDNVISANDDEFFKTLSQLMTNQEEEMRWQLYNLNGGSDLKSRVENYAVETDSIDTYRLLIIAKYLAGEIQTESFVYDLDRGTSRITEDMIENYKANRDKYYLTLVDIHC